MLCKPSHSILQPVTCPVKVPGQGRVAPLRSRRRSPSLLPEQGTGVSPRIAERTLDFGRSRLAQLDLGLTLPRRYGHQGRPPPSRGESGHASCTRSAHRLGNGVPVRPGRARLSGWTTARTSACSALACGPRQGKRAHGARTRGRRRCSPLPLLKGRDRPGWVDS